MDRTHGSFIFASWVSDEKEVLNGIGEKITIVRLGRCLKAVKLVPNLKGRSGMAGQKKVGILEIAPLSRVRGCGST